MAQPVTAFGSFELASKLEELSGLASQIVRYSDELRTVSQGDFSGNSASVCALLPVALSSARICLTSLQFVTNQTPISPPPPSSFVPSALGPPVHSPTPTPSSTKPDLSVSPAEPWGGQCSTIQSRTDSSVVDPKFSTPEPTPLVIGTSRLPANSLDLPFPFPLTTPATRMWPILPPPPPPVKATLEPSTRQTSGGCSVGVPTRHGVTIAELVDEENSSPDTRGGINPSRSAATCVNMSSAHYYPPLTISVVDVTPRSMESEMLEASGMSQVKFLRSPSSSYPETPEYFTVQVPESSQGPPVSPASSRTARQGGKTPRRSKPKGSPLTTPEVPEGRVTRSRIKRKAAEDPGVGTRPSKRVKIGLPKG